MNFALTNTQPPGQATALLTYLDVSLQSSCGVLLLLIHSVLCYVCTYVCLCVCKYTLKRGCAHPCICVKTRRQPCLLFPSCQPAWFLSLLLIRLGWLSRKPQLSTCPHVPSAGMATMPPPYTALFYVASGDQIQVPCSQGQHFTHLAISFTLESDSTPHCPSLSALCT